MTAGDREAWLRRALQLAEESVDAGGRPFGSIVVRDGEVVGEGTNRVVQTGDPTWHAELAAIRAAASQLGRPELSDCELYSSGEPCPMCFSACYLAGVTSVYHCLTVSEAASFGFPSAALYQELALPAGDRQLQMVHLPLDGAITVYERWAARTQS
jgi:guanine deaminase